MRALLRIALLSLGALLLAPVAASAQTQRFQLTDQTWVDLGAAPYTVRTLGSPAAIVIDTTAPNAARILYRMATAGVPLQGTATIVPLGKMISVSR